jgi:hypothetical protein
MGIMKSYEQQAQDADDHWTEFGRGNMNDTGVAPLLVQAAALAMQAQDKINDARAILTEDHMTRAALGLIASDLRIINFKLRELGQT